MVGRRGRRPNARPCPASSACYPPTQGAPLLALWQEFEDAVTPEARFAHAVDRAMPALLNLANGGQSWRENGITHARVVARIGPPIKAGCPALWAYMEERLDAGPPGRLVRDASMPAGAADAGTRRR